MKFSAILLASIIMIQDSIGLSPEIFQYKTSEKPGFFPVVEGGKEAVIMTYWYDNNPWIDEARTAWIGVNDGYAMDGVDHVIYHVSGRGTVHIPRPTFLASRNARAFWIGFTGSRAHASSVYGKPVVNLVEIGEGEVVEVSAILVTKSGHKAISDKRVRIGVLDKSENPIQPWRYKFE